MKVRVRSTAAGPWGVLVAGATGEVPEVTGRAMVAAGAATEVVGRGYPYEEPAVIIPPPVVAADVGPEERAMLEPARRRRKRATLQESGVPA